MMTLCSQRVGFLRAIAAAICAWLSVDAFAQAPGVPSLPSTLRDYFGYAVTDLPDHFANGLVAATDNTPVDNPITNAGATLGRVLFYDARLSHDNGTSCSSCHQQATGFDDPNQLSEGFDGGLTGRHSTPLANAAYYTRGRFFWDERAETLEDQVLMPIQDPVEMGSTLPELRAELASTDYYPKLFQQAFGTPEITDERIAKALGQFVRSMKSYSSKYDQAVEAGTPENPNFEAVFTELEQQGADLFLHGEGRCSECHTTHAQVGDQPRNVGLDATNDEDAGAGSGRFKTMSLRNVGVREHFMHDGRFSSLEEVIEFYNSGVQNNPTLDNRMKMNGQPMRLNYTPEGGEVAALVAFLNTLTDESFLTNDLFSNPFVQLPGDYDGNGVVDAGDYTVWKQEFGLAASWADGNLDGTVNLADYTIWRDNLGASWEDLAFGASANTASIPEPGTLLLAATGLLVGLHSFRRRSSRALK